MFRRGGLWSSLAMLVVAAACLAPVAAGAGAAVPGIDASYGEGGIVRPESQVPSGFTRLRNSLGTALPGPRGAVLYMSQFNACANPVPVSRCESPLMVRRFAPSGALDPSYGDAGVLDLGFTIAGGEPAVAVDLRGRLLVARNEGGRLRVLRFTAAGRPDASFGKAGVAGKADLGSAAKPEAILPGPHGRLIVAAAEAPRTEAARATRVILVRLLADGRIDRRYGRRGTAVLGIASTIRSRFYATPTGATLVTGSNCCSSDSYSPVERVTAAGKVDVRFNGEARRAQVKALASFPETRVVAVVPAADRTIELLGSSQGHLPGPGFALRLTAKGRADARFGDGGLVKLDTGLVSAGAGSRGSTVAVFETFPEGRPGRVRVERLLADGRPDPRFGGKAGIALPERGEAAFLASSGGRTLLAGTSEGRCELSCEATPYLTRLIEPSGPAGTGKGGGHR